ILELEHPVIPDVLSSQLMKLLDICIETYEALKIAIGDLFEDLEKVKEHVLLVEQKEHEADNVERCLIKQIYKLDISHGHKFELKELVQSIADISDRAEDCSDRVEVVSMKRRV
ncbi:MAG TPA: TIGR00153 family protein, partial [Pseudothermotoga sp.]|nr:TIGR00153 family protein [Pseudothermotoga sp.]